MDIYLGPEVLLLGQLGVFLDHGGVRVELRKKVRVDILSLSMQKLYLQHAPDVLQRVGPDHSPGHLAVGCTEDSPDGLGLEQSGEVGVGHLGLRKVPASLRGGRLSPGAVESI